MKNCNPDQMAIATHANANRAKILIAHLIDRLFTEIRVNLHQIFSIIGGLTPS